MLPDPSPPVSFLSCPSAVIWHSSAQSRGDMERLNSGGVVSILETDISSVAIFPNASLTAAVKEVFSFMISSLSALHVFPPSKEYASSANPQPGPPSGWRSSALIVTVFVSTFACVSCATVIFGAVRSIVRILNSFSSVLPKISLTFIK